MKIPLSLTKGLSQERKTLVEAQYQNSYTLLRQLKSVIEEKIEAEYEKEELSSDINSVFKSLGYRRGLREILNLLPTEKDNDNN